MVAKICPFCSCCIFEFIVSISRLLMHSGSIGDVIARGFVFASSGYVHLCVTARTDFPAPIS